MPVGFDPGYSAEPFRTLVWDVPGVDMFPTKDFRTEWGPVFHRRRLDEVQACWSSAKIPRSTSDCRRTLVDGHRIKA